MNQDILAWINEQKKQGYTSEQLKNSLIQRGYPLEEVNQAINISFSQVNPDNSAILIKTNNKRYLIIIALVILGLFIGAYLFLYSQGYFTATKGNVEVESDGNSTRVILSTSDIPSRQCTFSNECSEGLECIQDKCTTIEDFYEENIACCEEGMLVEGVSACVLAKQNTNNVVYSCEQFECEDCKDGFQSCIYSQTNGFFSYCAECLNSFSCNEGFNCEFGKCVPK